MKILSILPTLILTLLISSCGTMPGMSVLMAKKEAAKLRPAYKKFENLCKSEKRSKIYKSASAEGYLYARTSSASCSDWHPDLRKSDYKFIECSRNNINDYAILNNGRLVRFRIVKKENTSCMYNKEGRTISLEEYYEGVHILNLNNYETLAVNRDYTYWPEGISMQIKYTCEDKSKGSIFSVGDVLIP